MKRFLQGLFGVGRNATEVSRQEIIDAARADFAAGKFVTALQSLSRALQAQPDDSDALALKGVCHFRLEEYRQAALELRRAIERAPENFRAFKFLAFALLALGKDAEAQEVVERACALSEEDAQLLTLLGLSRMHAGRYAEAALLYCRALELEPNDPVPLQNLLHIEFVAEITRRRITFPTSFLQIKRLTLEHLLRERGSGLDERRARLLMILASANREHIHIALEEAQRVVDCEEIEAETAFISGQVFAVHGDLLRTIGLFERACSDERVVNPAWRLILSHMQISTADERCWLRSWRNYDEIIWQIDPASRMTQLPLWNGETLGDGRLFVYQDQGVGDLLLSLRILKIAVSRGVRVVFWCDAKVISLLEGCISGLELVYSRERPDPALLGCNALAPLLRLVHLLGLSPADLREPTLISAPRGRCDAWLSRLRLEKRPKIGLALTGNPERDDDWFRSLPAEAAETLALLGGNVQWVNLAVDVRPERDMIIQRLVALDPTPDLQEFSDTAAIISELDCVVAIDCSVAHLAAALGKPVLALISPAIDWRWIVGDDPHPWWPSAKMFRCAKPADWNESLSTLVEVLADVAGKNSD